MPASRRVPHSGELPLKQLLGQQHHNLGAKPLLLHAVQLPLTHKRHRHREEPPPKPRKGCRNALHEKLPNPQK